MAGTGNDIGDVSAAAERGDRPFARQRMFRMGLSGFMMLICFPLYYLGLFGGEDGPLNPERIGSTLAGLGITALHLMVSLLVITVLAFTWSLLFNAVAALAGLRLTCVKRMGERGTVCGSPTTRRRVESRKTGIVTTEYLCRHHQHRLQEAHFHPAAGGTISNAVGLTAAVLCGMVYYMTYLG